MEIKKIAKQANIINTAMAILALVMYILFRVTSEMPLGILDLILWGGYIIAAIIILVFACITFSQMKKSNVKGGGCMLAAAIVTMVFSIFALALGIIVWILVSISMKQIRSSEQDHALMARMEQQNIYANTEVDGVNTQL